MRRHCAARQPPLHDHPPPRPRRQAPERGLAARQRQLCSCARPPHLARARIQSLRPSRLSTSTVTSTWLSAEIMAL